MPSRKIVARFVEDAAKGRVVVTRDADGEISRTPVKPTKPTRRPRLRRQTLMKRPAGKSS